MDNMGRLHSNIKPIYIRELHIHEFWYLTGLGAKKLGAESWNQSTTETEGQLYSPGLSSIKVYVCVCLENQTWCFCDSDFSFY